MAVDGTAACTFLIEAAREMPAVNCGDVFRDAIQDFNAQYVEMAAGRISVAEGLRRAQAGAMERHEAL